MVEVSHNESPHGRGCPLRAKGSRLIEFLKSGTTSQDEKVTRTFVLELAQTSAGRVARPNFFQVLHRVIY